MKQHKRKKVYTKSDYVYLVRCIITSCICCNVGIHTAATGCQEMIIVKSPLQIRIFAGDFFPQ